MSIQKEYDTIIEQALKRYEEAVQYCEDRIARGFPEPGLALKLAAFEIENAMVIATHR